MAVLYTVTGGAAAAESLTLGGTGAALGAMRSLVAAFSASRPEVTFEILPSLGSGGGIKALYAGKIDLALSARPLKDKEKKGGAVATAYGRTAVVFAVPMENPATELTSDWLAKALTREIQNWPHGPTVRPVLRPAKETDSILVARDFPNLGPALAEARERGIFPMAYTDQDAADAIEDEAGAIGTAALSLILGENRRLKALSIDGMAATAETIADGSYPMTKVFYFVLPSDPKPQARAFADFLKSEEGRAILAQRGHQLMETDAQ
jgi:phosphate transport system substrate-binding protein